MTENLKQEGIEKWLQNIATQWTMNETGESDKYELHMRKNEKYDTDVSLQNNSIFNKQAVTAILKTQAEIGNLVATKLMANEKTKLMYSELLNETRKVEIAQQLADQDAEKVANDKVKALAVKLAAEFTTGDHVTWKSIMEAGKEAIGLVAGAIGKGL